MGFQQLRETLDSKALLEQLLPHRDPMVLLEEVLSVDDDHARTTLLVGAGSAFYRPELGGVPSWLGLEYMAQTIAVWSGDQLLKHGRPLSIGFLLGTRRFQTTTAVFTLGTRLLIDTTVVYLEVSGLSSFDCTIRVDSGHGVDVKEPLASARINAFRPDDHRVFLQEGRKIKE